MSRRIVNLTFAAPCDRPASIPLARPRGAKAAGLRYEQALASTMPIAKHGVWFTFRDKNGLGWCQTDLLLPYGGTCFVLECKYSWTFAGHEQIEQLYVPVVSKALGRRVRGLVVCRRLATWMPADVIVCSDVYSALRAAEDGRRTVWHWLGTPALAKVA